MPGVLRATLREVEPGLFSAEYLGKVHHIDDEKASPLDRHIGTDADGVKQWVEAISRRVGFGR